MKTVFVFAAEGDLQIFYERQHQIFISLLSVCPEARTCAVCTAPDVPLVLEVKRSGTSAARKFCCTGIYKEMR